MEEGRGKQKQSQVASYGVQRQEGRWKMEDPDFRYSISDLPFSISRYPILFLNVKLRTVLVDDIYCQLRYNVDRR
jgi:hypothetical protein